MDHIVGILPAGGRARRIHGFFKEMMPIGISETNKSRFVVSSERIIRSILDGGASSVHFLLNSQKSFIAEYYAKQEIFTGRINFNYITSEIEALGMPYALDNLYDQTKDFDYVFMGMPDTVVDPPNSFQRVFDIIRKYGADIALGVYRTDNRNHGGYVKFNSKTKIVNFHVDKTSLNFPSEANNAWAVVCWNQKFTQFMHETLKKHPKNRTFSRELLFGSIIDEAIDDPAIRIVADYVDEDSGFYWDIGDPEKYFDLLRSYYSSESRLKSVDIKRVFLGHGRSSCWKDLRTFLQDRLHLEWDEFNRIPVAGIQTQQRIAEMLGNVSFAFLIMTAEEEGRDGKMYARDNVIHELGLFQGALGFHRAIVLLEEGCEEFSNIHGLTQIRFPKNKISAAFEEIRKVLEREKLV